jgi:hypothetical protein
MNDQYLFDSNVFIQSKNTHYSFDIAPSFWSKLNSFANDGAFAIIDKVYDELTRGKDNPDDLCSWIMEAYKGEVLPTTKDKKVLSKYKDIQDSIKDNSQYSQSAKDEFATYENADAWIIAYATVYNYKVVTFEKYEPNSKQIKIPNVCEKFNVECIDLFDFMRNVQLSL